jgi:hypothetical protein
MADSTGWRFQSVDATHPTDDDRWRAFNANNDLVTELIAGLERRIAALEAEVAKLSPSQPVGDDDTATN